MNTPPDGTPPRMQMYLQHLPGTTYSLNDEPFPADNTGDEANTVYHEYTHGLSNRLVVDANGNSTLGPIQAGAMGEAWSDWYANDYLVSNGLEVDKKGVADLDIYKYDGLGSAFLRTQGMDCVPSSPACRLPRRRDRSLRWLHLRRLRQGGRPGRGARGRRDLGPDPLGRCATRSAPASR